MRLISILFLTVILVGCSTSVPVKRNFPQVPAELLAACPELAQTAPTTKLSDVLVVVTKNYSKYHECRIKTDAWIEWYKTQQEIFNSIN